MPPPAGGDELKFLKLTFDYSDVEKLQKLFDKIGDSGKKSMNRLVRETRDFVEEIRDATKSFDKIRRSAELIYKKESQLAKRTRAENIARVQRARDAQLAVRRAEMHERIEARRALASQRAFPTTRAAVGTAIERARFGVRSARSYLGDRFRTRGGFGRLGRDASRGVEGAVGVALTGITKVAGVALNLIKNSPIFKLLEKISDFEGMFRFNREVLSAVGGVSMLGRQFNDLTKATARPGKRLSELGDILHDTGTNFRFMMNAEERAREGLAGVQASGMNASRILGEGFSNMGDVMTDITLQSRVFSRVLGKSIGDISTMMGDMMYNVGLGIAEMGDEFARMISQSTKLNISQGAFMDLIRTSTQNMGAYRRVLRASAETLAMMAAAPSATPKQVKTGFEALSSVFENQNAQVMLTSAAQGTGPFREAVQRMLAAEMGAGGAFAKDVAAGKISRANLNEQMKGMSPDDARRMQETFENVKLLQGILSGSANFFDIQASAAEGGIGTDIATAFMNQLARQFGTGGAEKGVRDVSSQTLYALSQMLGLSMNQMRALQRTVATDEELQARLRAKAGEESPLMRIERIFQDLKAATEGPAKGFEIIIEELVRTIQQLIMELVKTLMPIAIDILSAMLTGIGNMVKGLALFVEDWVNAGQISVDMYNFGVAVAGGTKLSSAAAGAEAKGVNWEDKINDPEWMRKMGYSGDTVEGIGPRLRMGAQLAYGSGIVSAQESIYGKGGTADQARDAQKQLADELEKLRTARGTAVGDEARILDENIKKTEDMVAKLNALIQQMSSTAGMASQLHSAATDPNNWLGVHMTADAANKMQQTAEQFSEQLRGILGGTEAPPRKTLGGSLDQQYWSLFVPARQAGGIDMTPTLATIAEQGPEATIPLARVPDVFARTIDAAGGTTGGIRIGQLVFNLDAAAVRDPEAFGRAVRQILQREFEGMLQSMRGT